MMQNDFKLLTLQQMIDQFGVSRSTIDRWRKVAGIPYIKIGKEIFFQYQDVMHWLHQQRTATKTIGTKEESDERIVVGYQSRTAHMWSPLIMKELRLFEEELLKLRKSYVVDWEDAASGSDLVEKMVAKNLHFASIGDYPITICHRISQLLPGFNPVLIAFDGKSPQGKGISLVWPSELSMPVEEQVSITSVKHSSAEYRLNRILENKKLKVHVMHQNMHESYQHFINRKVSYCIVWEPYVSLLQTRSNISLQFEEHMDEDYLTGVITDHEWAQRNEDVVLAYLRALLRAHKILREYPVKAAQIISSVTEIPVLVALRVINQVRWDASFSKRDLETLRRLTPHEDNQTKLECQNIFKDLFLHDALKQVGLPYQEFTCIQHDWSNEIIL